MWISFRPHNICILWESSNQILIWPDDKCKFPLAYRIKTAVAVGRKPELWAFSPTLPPFLLFPYISLLYLARFFFFLSTWFYLYACTICTCGYCWESLSNTIMYCRCSRHALGSIKWLQIQQFLILRKTHTHTFCWKSKTNLLLPSTTLVL